MERVVAPVDQVYPPADASEAVSTTPVPGQMVVDPLEEMEGTAGEVTSETEVTAEVAAHVPDSTVTV